MIPVNTLTEAQAAEELGCLLDARPAEDDQLALIHWQMNSAVRVDQLERHIAHLQATPAAAPEPPSKLALLIATYNANVAKVVAEPDRLVLRQRVSHAKHDIKVHCRRTKQPMPELLPLPPTPEKPARVMPEAVRGRASAHARLVAEECEERSQTLAMLVDVLEPGLDNCHTAPEPAQADVYAHHCDISAADLDVPPTAIERADQVVQQMTALLHDLVDLDDTADREAVHERLHAIWHRLRRCYQMVAEDSIEEAG